MKTTIISALRRTVIFLLVELLSVQYLLTQNLMPRPTEEAWQQVRILDLNSMPWTTKRLPGWKFKDIHANPATGAASWLIFVPPNWSTNSSRHYDHENGWSFFLQGGFAVIYYKNPQDQVGTVYPVKAGDLFYGVEGAIHNFDQRTLVPEGCILLSWHDKPTSITPVPFDSKETTLHGDPWPNPKNFDTRTIEWEKTDAGYMVKKLYQLGGATMEMRYYPPGWKSSGPREYADYQRWMYLLDGDLNLRRATKGEVVEVPAHAILGGGTTIESGESGSWVLLWREQNGNIFKLE